MKTTFFALVTAALLWCCALTDCGGGANPSFLPLPLLALEITSGALPSGITGAAYAGTTGFLLAASGGVAPYKWSWAAAANSSLPPGLTVTQATISGTPTAPGSYEVTVTVADSESPAARKSATYAVSIDMPLAITSDAPPFGAVGATYGPASTGDFSCVLSPVLGWHYACTPCSLSAGTCPATSCSQRPQPGRACFMTEQVFTGFMLTAAGGMSPYTWSATGMPPGLGLDPGSVNLSGTPTTAGSYSVSVTVSDSESPPAQVSMTYAIDILVSSSP